MTRKLTDDKSKFRWKEFRLAVFYWMIENSYGQNQLARLCGIPKSSMSKFINGGRLDLDCSLMLCEKTGLKIRDFCNF